MSLARKYVAFKVLFSLVISNDLMHLIVRFAHGPMTRTCISSAFTTYAFSIHDHLSSRSVLAGYLGPPVPNAYPIRLVQEKARGKQEEDMLLDESDELTSWYDSGWLGRDILTQSKIVMYWTYCAIEGLATVWTCIINQEIQYEKEETRCRETRQSSSLDILDLSVAKPFIAILNLLVGSDV